MRFYMIFLKNIDELECGLPKDDRDFLFVFCQKNTEKSMSPANLQRKRKLKSQIRRMFDLLKEQTFPDLINSIVNPELKEEMRAKEEKKRLSLENAKKKKATEIAILKAVADGCR